MATRNPQKRLTSQIVIAGLAISLAIVVLGLTYIIPGIEITLVVFIPFLSSLLVLKSNYKGQLLYFFGIVAVCFIDLQEGFFTLLPNCLIGLAFGNMVKKYSLNYLSYLVLVLTTFIIEVLLIYPINFFFQVNLLEVYANLFKIPLEKFTILFPSFYLLITASQSLITYIVVSNQLEKLPELKIKDVKINPFSYLILDAVILIATIVCYFFSFSYFLFFICLNILVCSYQIFKVFEFPSKKNILIMSSFSAVGLLIFIVLVCTIITQLENRLLTLTIFLSILSLLSAIMIKLNKNCPAVIKTSQESYNIENLKKGN